MNRTRDVRSLATILHDLPDVSFSINLSEMVQAVDLVEDARMENARVVTLSIPLKAGILRTFEVSFLSAFLLIDLSLTSLLLSLDSRHDRCRHYRTLDPIRYHPMLLLWRKKNSRFRGTKTCEESSLLFKLRRSSSSNERLWRTSSDEHEQQWLLRSSSRCTSSSSSQSIEKIDTVSSLLSLSYWSRRLLTLLLAHSFLFLL